MKRKVCYAQFYSFLKLASNSPIELSYNTVTMPVETMELDRSWSLDKKAQVAREHLVAKGYYAFSLHMATKEIELSSVWQEGVGVLRTYANAIEIRPMEIHLW